MRLTRICPYQLKKRRNKTALFLALLPVLALIFSLSTGRYPLSLSQIAGFLLNPDGTAESNIFFNIRLPRVLFSLLAGGALGVAGGAMQGLFRNPLASPDVIGVSSGASLGAAIAIILLDAPQSAVQLFAFLGGIIAVVCLLFISKLGRAERTLTIILSGIIISALCQAGVSMLKYMADPMRQLPALEFWLMGSLNGITWAKLAGLILPLIIGCILIFAMSWKLDALAAGDEGAAALGVSVPPTRVILICGSALLVGAVVSYAGAVGWIGLIAPHIVKRGVGEGYIRVIPLSFCCGGAMLSVSDTIARSLTTGELPVSIISAVVGAPFLVYFMSRGIISGGGDA